MLFYTTAPLELDFSDTNELEPRIGVTPINRKVRLVLIVKDLEDHQCGCYDSGLYMSLHQDEFDRELKNEHHGLVVSSLTSVS